VGATLGATAAYFSDTETSTGNVFAAGSIDLKIDNECRFMGGDCPWENSDWELTDLEEGVHKFFNFQDLKPGAYGEDTISLHIYENDAWGWLKIWNLSNLENGCTEPEEEVDSTCDNPGQGQGELFENLNFLIWQDDGDNIYEAGEEKLHEGVLPECQVWAIDGDGTCCEPDPLEASHDYYLGIKWCFGTFDSNYNCQGTTIGNEGQTDSVTLDIGFFVVQSQNNPNAEGGPTCGE
jgi:predicted ribosomally synthesized peptide with SipW-like signal peptide